MKTRGFFLTAMIPMLACCFSLFAQEEPNRIVPVSPEAAALAKMVNYPVNLNTGIPDINIPFYEINVGGMSLPITLNYHAGGFRINEQATRAGLGWSLSSDLQITRSVNGKDDFDPSWGYLTNQFMKVYHPGLYGIYPFLDPAPNVGANLYELAVNTRDGMPDKFNYKLLNKSGSFYFLKNSSGAIDTILPVPYDNIKIQYDNGRFIVTDTDGTVYYFGEPGTVGSLATRGIETSISSTEGSSTRTAWKCKRIVGSNRTDEIIFSYEAKDVAAYRSYNDRVEYYSNGNPCYLEEYHTSNQESMNGTDYGLLISEVPFHTISTPKYMEVFSNSTRSRFHVPYVDAANNNAVVDKVYDKNSTSTDNYSNVSGLSVTEIVFRGGKVVFNGVNDLSSIQVLDDQNNEVKSLHFFQSFKKAQYASESTHYNGYGFQGTRYLDSLHVRSGSSTYERYALVYNDKFCYGNHLKGHDAWGYPNAGTIEIAWANTAQGNILSIPGKKIIEPRYYFTKDMGCSSFATDIPITIGGDVWMESADEAAMKRGVLKRIVYPTGGYVDFDFEANQYQGEFTNGIWPQRLPQLSGGLRIRSINYYDLGDVHPKSQKYFRYGEMEEGTGLPMNRPELGTETGVYNIAAVSYEQEIQYLEIANAGDDCNSRACLIPFTTETMTTYQPASALDYTYGSGAPIYYTKVTEYQQDLGEQTGKTVHKYYDPGAFHNYQAPLILENRIPGTNLNFLKTDGLMGALESVTKYRMEQDQRYSPLHRKNYSYESYVHPKQVHVAYSFLRVIYRLVGDGTYTGTDRDFYVSHSNFFNGAGSSPFQEYVWGEYGIPSGKLLMKKEEETWFEDGAERTLTNEYDYGNLPNLQASVITTTDSRGEKVAKTLKYARDFATEAVYAKMVEYNMVSPVIEQVERNTSSGKEISRTRTHYKIWPVGWNLIALDSVQRSVKGEAFRTEMTIQEYDQYGNVLQRTGSDGIPTSYLWGYDELYPVAELRNISYASIPIAYKSNVQINNPASDASLRTLLGGLRSSFGGEKEVGTYTYKRLVGVTSQTAPNGRTGYHEYDGIGRLFVQRDHEQQVVNRYDYRMVGPSAAAINQLYEVNVPMMRTQLHFFALDGYFQYNNTVLGGKYVSNSVESANSSAKGEANYVYYPGDPQGLAMEDPASITLGGEYSLVYPTMVEVDFLQGGSIVATQQVNSHRLGDPNNHVTIKIPEGEYQISVRINADLKYMGGILGYTLFTLEDESTVRFHSGDTISFERWKNYTLYVSDDPN